MSLSLPKTEFRTVAEIVRQYPYWGGKTAVQFFNGYRIFRHSYAAIHERVLRCVSFLESKGVRRGDRILLWSPNCPEWVVVFSACAIRGIVLVPLDARHDRDFIDKVARETEAKLLVRSAALPDPGAALPTVFVESLFDDLAGVAPADDDAEIGPDDRLEIAYTSGTTGDPKGIVLTHGNVASNVSDIVRIADLGPAEHLLSVLPLSHALEQTGGLWCPVARGAKVTYPHALKPSALFEVFRRDPPTMMIVVPRLFESLRNRIVAKFREAGLAWYVPGSFAAARALPRWARKIVYFPVHRVFGAKIRFFICGGAFLDVEVEKFWNSLGFEILQGYGLTETSPVLTVGRPGRTRIGSVGQAMDRVELRVGEGGEILARGPNVFREYYKKPEATREVFENGWFKTGDVGAIDADGFLRLRSRKKDMIVTAEGFNVYPEDVESALARVAGVRESCVLGVGPHEERIHAVLLLEGAGVDPAQCVRRANERLSPDRKIADFSVWAGEEFPKTPTLKIKRREVRRALEGLQSGPHPETVAKGSRLHQLLAEASRLPPESLRSDLRLGADLGLGSIDVVELILRLEQEFQIEIDDATVTSDATVRDIEELIENPGKARSQIQFRRWTLSLPCRAARFLFEWAVLRPALRIFCDVRAKGLENVRAVQGPVLVVSNHTSHVDTALILTLLPPRLGRRICPAALKEYFDTAGQPLLVKIGRRLAWEISTIFLNIFPFPQERGFRKSMVYAGELADANWNILVFPEGQRAQEDRLETFANGIGLLHEHLRLPIIPVATRGGAQILPRGKGWPKRGVVRIAFGKPFVPQETSYAAVTARVRREIERLWENL